MNKQKKQQLNDAARGRISATNLKRLLSDFVNDVANGKRNVDIALGERVIIIFAEDGSTLNISYNEKGGRS